MLLIIADSIETGKKRGRGGSAQLLWPENGLSRDIHAMIVLRRAQLICNGSGNVCGAPDCLGRRVYAVVQNKNDHAY